MAEVIDSSIQAKEVTLKCYGGDTWSRTLKFWAGPGLTNPIDVSTYHFAMEVKDKPGVGAVKMRLTDDINGGIVFNVGNTDNNQIDITKKISLLGKTYAYDLQITYPDGSIATYMFGPFIVQQDVTDTTGEK